MTEKYLGNHFKVFKQFLDISDDPSNKSKAPSVRAARAREKLLNLSEAQFRELSTDVYDELKRRIDESRRQPEYLLPKSTFHPKRNQARERLSTLPQNRFKGLVSDVSYEIERRNLHVEPESEPEQEKENYMPYTAKQDHYHEPFENNHVKEKEIVESIPDHVNNSQISNNSKDVDLSNQTIGLSSKTVVPTRANLDWSSDEEQEPEKELEKEPVSKGIDESVHLSTIEDLKRQLQDHQQKHEQLKTEKGQLESDLKNTLDKNLELNQRFEQHDLEKSEWMKSKKDYDDKLLQSQDKSEYENLVKEFEALKATNAQLRLENQSLKNTSQNRTSTNTLSRDLSNMSPIESDQLSKNGKNDQLNSLLEKLSTVDVPPKKEDSFAQLKDEANKWQSRYEDLKADKSIKHFNDKNLLKSSQLTSLISPNGLISLDLVTKFQANIESFMISIDEKEFNSDSIFGKVSEISLIANKIANQSDNNQLNKNEVSTNVRDSASHLLTVTRYYSLYSGILPKFIIDRSVNDLVFSVCELVGFSKLLDNNKSAPIESNGTSSVVGNRSLNIEEDNTSNNIGVRPLRMANKLKSANPSIDSFHSTKGSSPPRTDTPNKSITATSKGISPQSSKINNLASRYENQSNDYIPSSNNTTPTKKSNILDRVKQFESPSPELKPTEYKLKKINSPNMSHEDESTSNSFILNRSSLEIKKTPTHSRSASSNIPGTFTTGAVAGAVGAGAVGAAAMGAGAIGHGSKLEETSEESNETKPRGILQTIRDKFGGESQDDNNNITESKQSQADTSNDENINSSTAETTPSKENVDEPLVLNNSMSKSSFVPLKDRINGEAQRTPSSAASDTTIKEDSVVKKEPVAKKSVKITEPEKDNDSEQESEEDERTTQARQRQEYRKSMAAATFNVDLFDIDDPDNTLTQVLLYLEHQTVEVISTIQMLLSTIKKPNATRGELIEKSQAITEVISQMTEATNTSMNQTRNAQLKEHGNWVVKSLEDCYHRMNILCKPSNDKKDSEFAERSFKQRLAGISFDIAKCTKELVKTVEEASLKEDIANLDARLSLGEDLT